MVLPDAQGNYDLSAFSESETSEIDNADETEPVSAPGDPPTSFAKVKQPASGSFQSSKRLAAKRPKNKKTIQALDNPLAGPNILSNTEILPVFQGLGKGKPLT